MKVLKRIILALVLFIMLLVTGAVVASFVYQDRITALLVNGLNRQINTKIGVGSIHFSLLKKFPMASLEFRDIYAPSVKGFRTGFPPDASDTLLQVHSLFLEFRVPDLIRKQYIIRSMQMVNGSVHLLIDSLGNENYHIWKAGSKDTSSSFSLELRNVKFNNIAVEYADAREKVRAESLIHKLSLKGNFSSHRYALSLKGSMLARSLSIDSLQIFSEQLLDLNIHAAVEGTQYKVTTGQLEIAGMQLSVTGEYNSGRTGAMNLSIESRKAGIASILELLPRSLFPYKHNIEATGIASFKCKLKGNPGNGKIPGIIISFTTTGAGIKVKNANVHFTELDLKGSYTNGKNCTLESSRLLLDNYSCQINQNTAKGSIILVNFVHPRFELNVDGTWDLETIKDWIALDSLEILSGHVSGKLNIRGSLKKFGSISLSELPTWVIGGQLKAENCSFKVAGSIPLVSNISGDFFPAEDQWSARDLSFRLDGNEYHASGSCSDPVSWLMMKHVPLSVIAKVQSASVSLNPYFSPDANQQGNADSISVLKFPDELYLNLDVQFTQLKLGKFEASNVTGKVLYKPFMFDLRSLQFTTMSGQLHSSMIILQKVTGDFVLRAQSTFDKLNIHNLFASMNNFGQSFIQDKHLKGILTGYANIAAEWDANMKLVEPSVMVESSVVIENGELIDFEPMLGLSKFIELNELKHVYFSTLKNDIFIKNRMITIPQMDINSSAFNIVTSGTHDFDNNFNYQVKVSLFDVLARNANKAKKENEEFGLVEEGEKAKLTLFLTFQGNADDYKVSYNSKQAAKNVVENLKKEKKEFKSILFKEFGLFKKDSASFIPDSISGKKRGFRIEWDGEQPLQERMDKDPLKRGNKQKYTIEWDEEPADTSLIPVELE
jgi:hypothetical protein